LGDENYDTLLHLMADLLNNKFLDNEKYIHLQFNILHGKIDSFIKETEDREKDIKEQIELAIIDRNNAICELKTDVYTKIDDIEGNVKIVNARVDVLETAGDKKASSFVSSIKGKVLEYFTIAGLLGLLYWGYHFITTGTPF
jgi:hypothetical protein